MLFSPCVAQFICICYSLHVEEFQVVQSGNSELKRYHLGEVVTLGDLKTAVNHVVKWFRYK